MQSLRHGAFQTGRRDVHEHHELLCVTQGSYAVSTQAGEWQGGPGEVFCYPAGTEHDVRLDPRQESHFLIVNWLQQPPPLTGPRRVHDRQGRILATMLWMFDRWPTADPATHHMLAGLLTALLHEIDLLAAATTLADDLVERAIQLMRADLHRRLTVQEMAEVVGLSRFHFSRRFQAATGCPPKHYLQRLRVETALHLIQASRLPLHAIATRCGMHSAARLSDLVLAHTGRRPSAWRG